MLLVVRAFQRVYILRENRESCSNVQIDKGQTMTGEWTAISELSTIIISGHSSAIELSASKPR